VIDREPEGWPSIPFDLLFRNVTSSTRKLPRQSYSPSGRYPVIDQGAEPVGGFADDHSLVQPGPFPVIVFGDHTRCVKFVAGPFVQGADGVKVLAPAEGVFPQYALWALRVADIPDRGYGRHFALARKLSFCLPPEPHQRRVVAAIDSYLSRLDEAEAALERVQRNLKRYRAAVLQAAVEGRLVPTEAELARAEGRTYEPASELLKRILAERRHRWEECELARLKAAGKAPKDNDWKEKYKEPVAADDAVPWLPEGWAWASLDQLCPIFVDCAHRTPKYSETGMLALRPRDVVGGHLDLAGAAVVSDAEFKIQTARRLPEPGDVIYSRELSFGWAALVPPNTQLCLSQGMALFRPGVGLDERFLVRLLNGPLGRRQAKKAATGSAHPHINLGDMRAYTFPLPPHAEQLRILAEIDSRLSIADEVENGLSGDLARSGRLRQAILKWAFEGKLVDQDPNDEPASVLLERIRAERAAQGQAASSSGAKRKKQVRPKE
jgi:type I restriction enzyme S subunit